MMQVLLNGEFRSAHEPLFQASNRAFRYGDSLFESMRWMNNRLQFAELHADRLQLGMKRLQLQDKNAFTGNYLSEIARQLVQRNELKEGARLRMSVFREGDGLYSPEQNTAGWLLEASPLPGSGYASYGKGAIIDLFEEVPKAINALSNLKTGNALVYVLAGLYKKQQQLDEVILLNDRGFLCEGSSTNLFVIYQGTVYTPALTEGCVSGVMRQVVIAMLRKKNIQVVEAQLNPAVLEEADEIFLTSATRGIQWVMGFRRKRFFHSRSRQFCSWLNKI